MSGQPLFPPEKQSLPERGWGWGDEGEREREREMGGKIEKNKGEVENKRARLEKDDN